MRFTPLLICLLFSLNTFAQQTYLNKKEDSHYCGPVTEAQLRDGDFANWFTDEDPEFELPASAPAWAANLNDAKVEVYLGTWCGDSKTWVPRFINYWKAAGLNPDQISFVALYDGDEKYKQGPSAEEKGRNVHRVPTFIFSREGEEFARIVEHPVTDLETDLAQIALGYPVRPAYAGANAMWKLLDGQPMDSIYAQANKHVNAIYRLTSRSSELNTLGYVLLRAGELNKALTAEF